MRIIKLADFLFGSFLCAIVPGRRKNAAINTAPRRVLVIRPGGIGDAVFLLPFLKAVKREHPTVQVDVLCEKRNSQIFSSQQSICREIYCYNDPVSFIKLWGNRYDIVIDTEQWHYLSGLVGYFLGAKHTVGFGTRPLRAKLFNQSVEYDLGAFELNNFGNLFRTVFPQAQDLRLCNAFEVPPKDMEWAAREIPEKSIAVFIGGSLPQKRLNPQQYIAIIRYILKRQFHPVLLGGRDAYDESRVIENVCAEPDMLLNLVGQLSLSRSAAAIKRSRLFVGTDSGLLHIACAVGVPTISVFGSSDPKKWGPREMADVVLSDRVPCAPCTYFSYSLPTCDGSYDCMTRFDTGKVIEVIEKKLGAV